MKTIEEFVHFYQQGRAKKPTEEELLSILDSTENRPIIILPNGEITVLGDDLLLAKATAKFVVKEIRNRFLAYEFKLDGDEWGEILMEAAAALGIEVKR